MDSKKHIVAVTAVVRHPDGERFLILKRGAHEIAFPGKWALPGGKAEAGETLAAVLKREVAEEAGIEIGEEKTFLKDYTFVRPDGQNVIGLCFLASARTEQISISKDFDDGAWIRPEELARYDHIAGMEEEVSKAFAQRLQPALS